MKITFTVLVLAMCLAVAKARSLVETSPSFDDTPSPYSDITPGYYGSDETSPSVDQTSFVYEDTTQGIYDRYETSPSVDQTSFPYEDNTQGNYDRYEDDIRASDEPGYGRTILVTRRPGSQPGNRGKVRQGNLIVRAVDTVVGVIIGAFQRVIATT